MKSNKTVGTVQTNEKIGIIVIGYIGSMTIGILGGKLVRIPPEDPSWGSIIAKAGAAAAVAKVEGIKSPAALSYAKAANEEFSASLKNSH